MESVSTKIYKSNYFILSMKKAPYSRRRAWGKKRIKSPPQHKEIPERVLVLN